MKFNLSQIANTSLTARNKESLTATNHYSVQFGVYLSKTDITQLLKSHVDILKDEERLELGESILSKLVFAFCDSAYIYQDNYADTLDHLQKIFYHYKNDLLDMYTDDELVEMMAIEYNTTCQGSLEYLEETILDKIARKARGTYEI